MKELEELEDKLDSTESKLTATLDKLLVEEKKKDECERAKGEECFLKIRNRICDSR